MKLAITILLLLQTSLAFAGREEREVKDKEAEPASKQLASAFKNACGCEPKMNVKWDTFKTKDQLHKIHYMAKHVSEHAPKYCDSDDSKKAMCQVKSIEIEVSTSATVNFTGGNLVITTDGNAVPTWEMITKQVDK